MAQRGNTSPLRDKWLSQMQTIKSEIASLLSDDDAFRRVKEIVASNPSIQKPHKFYRYLYDSYISHVLVGLRRQIKVDNNCISFAGLLTAISKHPEELSRSYYLSLNNQPVTPGSHHTELDGQKQLSYLGNTESSAIEQVILIEDDFVKYADASKTHICPDMVRRDLNNLRTTVAACEDFADKRIAHRDKREPRFIKTYADLDREIVSALEILQKMYEKYYHLFHAGSITVKPQYQGDWKAIFSEPWMKLN